MTDDKPLHERIKIFADGASLPSMLESARDPRIAGFTTNPTLMRQAGVADYRAFAHEALAVCRAADAGIELLWASPRELLNIVQAAEVGCDIITVTPDLLKKLPLVGKDLGAFSLDTVRMFHRDAESAGYKL